MLSFALAFGVKVRACNSVTVREPPSAKTVPSAFFSEPEVGIAVMEIVKESPSLSVGAERSKGTLTASSERVTVRSAPAIGELLLGVGATGLEEDPPPPPPQAATIKATRLGKVNFEKSLAFRNLKTLVNF